ncbi:TVP38/TMEM64 family protein [Halonotius terrestris]|nr:VTT domain-containing protein [Halonotius terrestris]
MRRRSRLAAGVLTVLSLGVVTWYVTPSVAFAWVDSVASRPFQYALLLVVAALLRPAVAWPTTALSVAVGYGYGPRGLGVAVALLVVTNLPPYWFGMRTASDGPVTAAGQEFLADAGDLRGLIGARFLPLPSDLVSVAAGATGVRLRAYLLGTAVGELPWAVLGVLAGHSLGRLRQQGLTGDVDLWLLVGMAAVGTLLLAGPCYRLLAGSETPTAIAE